MPHATSTTFGKTRLLIDAGTRPNALGEASLPDLSLLKESPDAILLTHAHSDHIGALSLLKKRFHNVPIYASRPTARIALDMLTDAVKVQEGRGAPLYTLSDVVKALADVSLLEPFKALPLGGIRVTPYPAGHLLGAVSYGLEAPEGSVFHSGDVSNIASYLTDAAHIPDTSGFDVVVCESTYGDTPIRKRFDRIKNEGWNSV